MQRFRPSFEDGDELLGAGDGIITVLVEDPAFGSLGGAELFGQRIALGYKMSGSTQPLSFRVVSS